MPFTEYKWSQCHTPLCLTEGGQTDRERGEGETGKRRSLGQHRQCSLGQYMCLGWYTVGPGVWVSRGVGFGLVQVLEFGSIEELDLGRYRT